MSGAVSSRSKANSSQKAEAEGRRLRHPQDTITEGVGINRVTTNWGACPRLDGAFRVTDAEAVAMSRHLRAADGLWVGSSAAVNCVGALRCAQALGRGHVIVTVLCDSGVRYQSKLFNPAFLRERKLPVPDWMDRRPSIKADLV